MRQLLLLYIILSSFPLVCSRAENPGLYNVRTRSKNDRTFADTERVRQAQVAPKAVEETHAERILTKVFVFEAFRESSDFPPNLPEPLKKALFTLDYKSFHLLKASQRELEKGQSVDLQIADQYTVHVSLLDKDSSGRYRIRVVIEEKTALPDGTIHIRKALDSVGAVVSGEYLRFCGLKLDTGDLVVVVSIEAEKAQNSSALSKPVKSIWQKTFIR